MAAKIYNRRQAKQDAVASLYFISDFQLNFTYLLVTMAQNMFCQYLFNKSVQFSDFMNYKKQPGESMEEYVNHFDRMYKNLEKH